MSLNLPNKKLLKIGEAARILGVSIDTLRRWEKSGRIETVRTPGGTRLYPIRSLKNFAGGANAPVISTPVAPPPVGEVNLPADKVSPLRREASLKSYSTKELLEAAEASPALKDTFALPVQEFIAPVQIDISKSFTISPNISIFEKITLGVLGLGLLFTLTMAGLIIANPIPTRMALNSLAAKIDQVLPKPAGKFLASILPDPPPIPLKEQKVLAASSAAGFLLVNTDIKVDGAISGNTFNDLTLSANDTGFTISGGTTEGSLTVTSNSAEINQNVSTTASPSFAAVNITGNKINNHTIPSGTSTFVGTDLTQTLTNKTISGGSNTLTNIANSSLTNSKVTISAGDNLTGGGDVSLGSSVTISLKSSPSVSGQVLLADGTASAPGLSFGNDTNTGLYRIGTDKIALITGGSSTQGITIDSSGNVGLNNASPSYKLDVAGTLNATGATTLTSTLGVTGATTLSSTLAVTSDTTLTGDLAINGADLTTTATTFNLVNDTATTINFGGGATTALNIGSGNSAYTAINLGTGTGADTINIGTGGTAADTITIGNNASSTSLALTSGTGSQTFTSSTASGTAFSYVANSVTTGNALTLSSTGTTTGEALDITGTWAPTDGSTNEAIDLNITHTNTTSADNFSSINLTTTDGTALGNTIYGLNNTLTLTGNAAKTGIAGYATITSSSTTADTIYAADFLADHNGAIGIGTKTVYGLRAQATSDTPTDTGGTINTYAGYFSATGATGGTHTAYGIYATASGADTNWAAYFAGNATLSTGSDILAQGAGTDIGSSSVRFANGYFDNIDATSIAGTVTGGSTTSSSWTINSDNATADTEDASLAFERGSTTPNSVIGWDSTNDEIDFNSSLHITGTTSLATAPLFLIETSANQTTGDIVDITATYAPTAGGMQSAIDLNITNANTTSANTLRSIDLTTGDATALGNTVTNYYSSLASTGNAAKTLTGYYGTVTSSSTTADTLISLDLATDVTGIQGAAGTRSVYGIRNQPSAGAESTAGTLNVYGEYVKLTADVAAGGTVNGYGLYVANGVFDTDGTSAQYGLYIEDQTGADTNYALNIAAQSAATTQAITIGALSGTTANTGINIGAISGTGATGAGITVGNISTTGTTNYGLQLGTMTGGTTSNYQISTGILTSATTTTNAQLNLGGVVTTGGTTNYGINVGALSGTGTTNYGINVAASTATGTTNYGMKIGAISGAASGTNYGLYVDTVSGATTANYSAIFAGGNVGIGDTTPAAALTVGDGDDFQVDSTGHVGVMTGTGSGIAIRTAGTYSFGGGAYGIYTEPTGDSGATTNLAAYYGRALGGTGTFTTTTMAGMYLDSNSKGASQTVTNNYGLLVASEAVTSTNNYGAYIGTISGGSTFNTGLRITGTAAASTNYAIYADSLAQNYFAGNVGIGDSSPDALLDLDSTDTDGGDFLITNTGIGLSGTVAGITSNSTTTGDILTISSTALTSGSALILTGPSSTGVTDHFVKVTADVGSASSLLNLNPDFSGSAVTGYGVYNLATDATANANTDYGYYGSLALTGNIGKTGVGVYSTVTSSSTTGDTLVAFDAATSSTGVIGSGNRNAYGVRSQPASTGASTTGTNNMYGIYSAPSSTLAAGSTENVYGGYFKATGTVASGTVNSYGLYIANPTMDTTGTSAKVGLYIEDLATTGPADTNRGICFDCDGTYSSSTAANGITWGSDANLVTLYRSASDTLKTDDALVVGGAATVANLTANGGTDTAIWINSTRDSYIQWQRSSVAKWTMYNDGFGGNTDNWYLASATMTGSPAVLVASQTGLVGIGTTYNVTPTATLQILTAAANTGFSLAGTAPASVAGNGTSAATNTMLVVGTAGGASSGTTGQTGGTGGALSLTAGVGGAVAGASGIGGAGGGLTLAGGAGGNGAATGGAGGAISITGGNAGTGGNAAGGGISLTAGTGTGTGNGGAFNIDSGVGGTSGTGGAINITAERGGSSGGNGGALTITSGRIQTGSGNGGLLSIIGGNGGPSGTGGAIAITSGAAATSGTGQPSGAVTIASGTSADGADAPTGAVIFQSGLPGNASGGATAGASGAVTVRSQAGGNSGTGTGGVSGTLTLSTGTGGAVTTGTGTGGAAGAINITGGAGGGTNAVTGGAGSAITLTGGAGGAGSTTGGVGGNITLTAGNAGSGGNVAGGAISLTAGTGTGSGAPGSITLTSNVATGTTTTSGFVMDATAITTGTGMYLTTDSVTTGKLFDIATTGNTWTGNGTTNGLVNLASTSTAGTGSSSSILLNLARSGTNANATHTAYGVYSAITNTGTTSTNVGGYFSASGATNNYGLVVPNGGGRVGIGTVTPISLLDVAGDTGSMAVSLTSANTNANTRNWAICLLCAQFGTLEFSVGTTQGGTPATASPKVVFDKDGNVGIGDQTPDALLDLDSSATTTNIFGILSTTLTTGEIADITATYAPTDGSTNEGVDINLTHTPTTLADNFQAINLTTTDGTSLANTVYNQQNTLTLTGNAAKTGYGVYSTVTSSSTVNDTLYGGYFATNATGNSARTANYGLYINSASTSTTADNVFGLYSNPVKTGNTQSGTQSVYGSYLVPSATGPSTGTTATTNVYGQVIETTATHAADAGTVNQYGLYVANGTSSTNGASTKYGLYVIAQTGADTNYALYTAGGTVQFTCTTSATTWTTSQANPSCSDYAEVYETDDLALEAGDIITLDSVNGGKVSRSGSIYQKEIIGIYSTSPGMLIGPQGVISAAGDSSNLGFGKVPVALTGRVPLKVSTENGAIEKGDFLTSSSIPGVAMKATKPGQVVGKALEDYSGAGISKIMVFVNVSFADPGNFLASLSLDDEGNLIAPKIKTDKLIISTNVNTARSDNKGLIAYTQGTDTANQPTYNIDIASSLKNLETAVIEVSDRESTSSARLADVQSSVATSSAALADLKSQINSLAGQIATSSSTPRNDTAELNLTPPSAMTIATQSAVLADLKVTSEATFSAKLSAYDLSVSNEFKSLGTASLGNTTIAGTLSVDGLFSITGGNTIDALGTLFLQKSPLATNIDMFAGKVLIDNTGKLTAQTISAKEYLGVSGTTVGAGKIVAGAKTVTINSTLVKDASRILITPTTETSQTLSVVAKTTQTSFTVSVPTEVTADISFDWFIINEAN